MSFTDFKNDDSAIGPLLGFLLVGGAAAGVFASWGWSAQKTGEAAQASAEASGSIALMAVAVSVMLLGGFLIGLSAWRQTVRFVPLGLVLVFLSLPFVGLDADAIQAAFAGSA